VKPVLTMPRSAVAAKGEFFREVRRPGKSYLADDGDGAGVVRMLLEKSSLALSRRLFQFAK
jgi:hypothetical protein